MSHLTPVQTREVERMIQAAFTRAIVNGPIVPINDNIVAMAAKHVGVDVSGFGTGFSFEAADLPGVNLTYSPSAETTVGTRGRSLDHLGFEVKNLEAFCRQLEAQGVTFDRPYAEVAALNLAIAFFTDPFGTYIELTEGLDAY